MPVAPTPDFLEGLQESVTVERDINATGVAKTAHGYAPRDFRVVFGLVCVRARLCRRSGHADDAAGLPVPVLRWRVLLGRALALDLTYRLGWPDPDRGGMTRYLYVDDADADYVTVQGLYSAVNCVEYLDVSGGPTPEPV